MRVAVVGAGGVGGLVGGLLARSGVDVAFVARGAQLRALRERGLRVESPRGTFHLARVEAADDPAQLAPADAVLVAVKGWQVGEVAARLSPLLAPGAFAVPLENGVEAPDVLARALGDERVVGGLCHMLSWVEEPGLVRHTGPYLGVTMGERRGGGSARIERLGSALREAGVDVTLSSDVEAAAWEKFTFISAFGGVGGVTRAPIGVVREVPEARAMLAEAMRETAATGRARGVRLAPEVADEALAMALALPHGATASMQRDIQAGRPSELLDQNGAVVRMAAERGVPVPTHRFILAALLPQERAAREAAAARARAEETALT